MPNVLEARLFDDTSGGQLAGERLFGRVCAQNAPTGAETTHFLIWKVVDGQQ